MSDIWYCCKCDTANPEGQRRCSCCNHKDCENCYHEHSDNGPDCSDDFSDDDDGDDTD